MVVRVCRKNLANGELEKSLKSQKNQQMALQDKNKVSLYGALPKRGIVEAEDRTGVDVQLIRLEEDIRRLKVEYDIFFNGGTKRAPYDTKSRVESTLKRLSDDRNITFAQRYQYNSLVARYNSFRELWRRTTQGREEAREPVHAKNVAKNKPEPRTAQNGFSFVCSDAKNDTATVKQIYESLVNAKVQCGESTHDFPFDNFQRQLVAQTERFKQTSNCERVSFQIGVENGRVLFKAKADK
ncbi:MAG: hypothetical protein H7Z37_19045 [Pyrinomonadaceae bacterium]|nr:hypothetical protein [Pyrinomonadaceae bacterium]